MKCTLIPALLLVTLSLTSVYGQEPGELKAWETRLDWRSGILNITIEGQRRVDEKNRLSQTNRQTQDLESIFPELFPEFLFSILVNSKNSFRDLMLQDSTFHRQLVESARYYPMGHHSPSSTLQSSRASWVLKLFPDIQNLLLGTYNDPRGLDLPSSMLERPSRNISSIIIYADDLLPWFGMDVRALLVPAMFPEILDQEGRVFLGNEHISPEYYATWGMVAYTDGDSLKNMSERIGNNPYVIRPRAIFGVYPVSPMISHEDIDVIKTSSSARKAIKEGRIIIVLDKSKLELRENQNK